MEIPEPGSWEEFLKRLAVLVVEHLKHRLGMTDAAICGTFELDDEGRQSGKAGQGRPPVHQRDH